MSENSAREWCETALLRTGHPDARAAMVTVTAERARDEADRSDGRRRRGRPSSALDGTPIVWKDLFDVAGAVTRCGSASTRDCPPANADDALVRRAQSLGLVCIGKTNLSEFAFSGLGINRHFGTPLNPVDSALVPGGSSSGAAVAVAAGIAPIAVGTDTSGSVRVPAAFTGCVGYRASFERYGRNGFRALSATLDSVGFLARDVAVIRRLDRLLVPGAEPAPALSPLRMVIPGGEWVDDCTAGVRASFDTAVDGLRERGAQITTVTLASLQRAQRLIDTRGTIVGADAYDTYRHLLAEPDAIEPATRRRLASNATMGTTVVRVREAMAMLREQFQRELGGAILLCPTVRHEPPRIDDLATDEKRYDAANASTLRTTMVLSYLGACGVSQPVPGVLGPCPSGMLLSAPHGHDSALLTAAVAVSSGAPLG